MLPLQDSSNMYLSINGTTDKLTLSNYFSSDSYKIEKVQFIDGTVWDSAMLTAKTNIGTSGNDYLDGTIGADILAGLAGNDNLNGLAGNDTLDGGIGNDYLYGNSGNDTYLFGKGDGQDYIYDYDSTVGNVDRVMFKADVSSSDVVVTRDSSNMYLSINGTTDKLTLSNYFSSDSYKIEKVQFIDGTVWDSAMLIAKTNIGTSGNDYLDGTIGADILAGLAGNDTYIVNNVEDVIVENLNEGTDKVRSTISYTLTSNVENLYLNSLNAINGTGNELDNNIYGNNASNTLDGLSGNDYLYGGRGNDVYLFGKGDGQDTINDYDITLRNLDTVMFKSGVSSSDVVVTRNSGNMCLSINGTTDKVTLYNYFSGNSYKIEKVQLSDGNYLSSTDIDKLIQSMSAYASTKGIALSSVDSVSKNADLMTMIASSWHK